METYFEVKNAALALKPRHSCFRCGDPIEFGVEVVQMWVGTEDLCVSPGFAVVQAEWHRDCFLREFNLRPRGRPYYCASCGRGIQRWQSYRCFVVGSETDENHCYAERRGKVLYNVEHHPDCQ